MYDLFGNGGPIMWPLLICSLVSLVLSIERWIFWWKEERNRDPELIESLLLSSERGDFQEALSLCNGAEDPASRVLAAGIVHRDYGLSQSMEPAALDEIERMKRGLGIMDTIITMAPLLGILGTVLGIIESFDILGSSGIENPVAVIGGIAQALVTTAAGLSVAIITLLPFNYLTTRVQKNTRRLENITSRFEIACRKGKEKDRAT